MSLPNLDDIQPLGQYRAHDEGQNYSWGDASVTIKISPEMAPITTFSAWTVALPEGKSADFMALSSVNRVYYCFGGSGQVELNGRAHKISVDSFIFCGRGMTVKFSNTGSGNLELMACSTPSAPETRSDLFEEGSKFNPEKLPEKARRNLGLLTAEEAATLSDDFRGEAYVMAEHEGDSYWQPEPSTGYVTLKTSTDLARQSNFGSAIQLLQPGATVVLHGHVRTIEMLMAVKGKGKVYLEGEGEKDFLPGSVALVGTRTLHNFTNTGDEDFIALAIATPTEIGEALLEIGVKRTPGDPHPGHIERDMGKLLMMAQKYGFILPGFDL